METEASKPCPLFPGELCSRGCGAYIELLGTCIPALCLENPDGIELPVLEE